MVHLAILGFLVTNEMEVWNRRLASEFVDELGLPEEHDMLLVFDCLLDLGSQEVTCLLFLDLVDITESSSTEFLDDFVSLV